MSRKKTKHGNSEGVRELEELEVMSKGDILELIGISDVEQFRRMTEPRMWTWD